MADVWDDTLPVVKPLHFCHSKKNNKVERGNENERLISSHFTTHMGLTEHRLMFSFFSSCGVVRALNVIRPSHSPWLFHQKAKRGLKAEKW